MAAVWSSQCLAAPALAAGPCSGLATMAAITYLLILLRARRFTATTVSFAALFYLAFGACLIPVLA